MIMQWIALIFGAAGSLVSVAQSRWCFVIWTVPNGYWSWYNWHNGERIQAGVFIVMFWTCLAGWLAWGRSRENRRAEIWNIQVLLQNDYNALEKRKNTKIAELEAIIAGLMGQRQQGLERGKEFTDRILRNRGDRS